MVSASQDTIVLELVLSFKVISPELVPSASTSIPISSGTTTVTLVVTSQISKALLSVIDTLYVVVVDGLADGLAAVGSSKPVLGDH